LTYLPLYGLLMLWPTQGAFRQLKEPLEETTRSAVTTKKLMISMETNKRGVNFSRPIVACSSDDKVRTKTLQGRTRGIQLHCLQKYQRYQILRENPKHREHVTTKDIGREEQCVLLKPAVLNMRMQHQKSCQGDRSDALHF
jgi:hypothetical protein